MPDNTSSPMHPLPGRLTSTVSFGQTNNTRFRHNSTAEVVSSKYVGAENTVPRFKKTAKQLISTTATTKVPKTYPFEYSAAVEPVSQPSRSPSYHPWNCPATEVHRHPCDAQVATRTRLGTWSCLADDSTKWQLRNPINQDTVRYRQASKLHLLSTAASMGSADTLNASETMAALYFDQTKPRYPRRKAAGGTGSGKKGKSTKSIWENHGDGDIFVASASETYDRLCAATPKHQMTYSPIDGRWISERAVQFEMEHKQDKLTPWERKQVQSKMRKTKEKRQETLTQGKEDRAAAINPAFVDDQAGWL